MEPAEPVRMAHLDMLRGVAAFLVLAAHLRGYLLPGFNELTQSGILIQVFYFATGLGHQSVVVFFVLSGYLVGGSVIENLLRQHFIWPRYLLRRLTRLWIVIVPALLLTLLFDSLGQYVTGGVGYDGQYWGLYNSGAHLARIMHDDHRRVA